MRVLLTGGGTAGHINPAVAIANYIKEKDENSSFLFVGTSRGLEKTLVPKCGYNIEFIEVYGLKRSLSVENFKVLVKYIKSTYNAKKIIKKFKPDVVIGTGGYVCAPVIKAAAALKIPTLIHEQNVFPGLAIKMLSQKADVTAISFKETKNLMKAKNMILTGNPLRPNLFANVNKEEISESLGFDNKPLVLMFGGSLGAEKLDDALVKLCIKGIEGFNLIASTGERLYNKVVADLKDNGIDINNIRNGKILPYIYNMENIFGAADLIIGRAGAITISEITALGKAAILIPSPYVAHHHQEYNAKYLEDNGAAVVVTEEELCGEKLNAEIDSILNNKDKLRKMRECSKKIGIVDACETIYKEVKKLVNK